uniref:FLZ-type domain-containing protein n=1 Tax=Setaria viridis TaxID=4556 RepID=A0A4U6W2S8_SETVI|nr:hypothetical protein SEVIR_2G398900v2 [Setaria viridis]
MENKLPLPAPRALHKPPPSLHARRTSSLLTLDHATHKIMTRGTGMLGGRASTIRNLLALADPGWSSPPSPSGSATRVPDGSLFAASYDVPPRRPWRPAAPTVRKLPGLPSCNPETSVGLLAAVAEPASPRLRVAGQVRAGASGIMAAVIADLNGDGTSDTEVLIACKRCHRRLNDRAVYLYMDKGFCMPECRYEYFQQELYEKRRRLTAETRESRRASRNGNADLHTEAADRSSRSIFFVADDSVAFP